jgi:hypothetical protein
MNDAAHYEVVAENVAGVDRTNAKISIEQVPSIDKTPIINPDAFRYLNNGPNQSKTPSIASASDVNMPDDVSQATPPKVIIPLKDVVTNEGEPVYLSTKIIGYPTPKIMWLHNNRPLLDSNRYT